MGKASIPVMRPRLPTAARILPYLRRIDSERWYSNFGPLSRLLEDRLSAHFAAPGGVLAVTSGTLGLLVALLAVKAAPRGHCIMPSWTFVATAHAARAAGLTPYFADVDNDGWALSPEAAAEAVAAAAPVAAVVVVCPFGAPIDLEAWRGFRARLGVPVVIDAAAGFANVQASDIPTVVSLHATKLLGIGEGGIILCRDGARLDDFRRRANHGFLHVRRAESASINAKMSEYHAAVGLAALEDWPEQRARHLSLARRYATALEAVPGLSLQSGYGGRWTSSTCNVLLPEGRLEAVVADLDRRGIETRPWWGHGCHRHPAFGECPRQALPVTETLAGRVLGLPYFVDMTEAQIAAVVSALTDALAR